MEKPDYGPADAPDVRELEFSFKTDPQFKAYALDVISAYRREIERRQPTVTRPKLITLTDVPDTFGSLPPGTITAFVGATGCSPLARAAKALRNRNLDELSELIDETVLLSAEQISEATTEAGVDVTEIANFGVLVYAGKTLSEAIYVEWPDELVMIPFAYTGGELIEDQFDFIQYKVDEQVPALDMILVKHDPKLSDLERAILAKVPSHASSVFVSSDLTMLDFAGRWVTKATRFTKQTLTKAKTWWDRNNTNQKVKTATKYTWTTDFIGYSPAKLGLDRKFSAMLLKEGFEVASARADAAGLLQLRMAMILSAAMRTAVEERGERNGTGGSAPKSKAKYRR